MDSGYIMVEDASNLVEPAALIKCQRHISLPDCFTLALAEKMGIRALFTSKEAEIIREMEKDPFTVEIVFLK